MRKICVVVGAGITGAAAAWELARYGYDVRVYEREKSVGGHVRTEWLHGIPFEPHGAHIFHTSDLEVWEMVNALTPFLPYRHRVLIAAGSALLSWPLQVSELEKLPSWEGISCELDLLPLVPDRTNFETYCVSIMGSTLYELTIRPYTEKQWGCAPAALSASIADGRVELRRDGYVDLFRDPFQGWPRFGYGVLVEALLESSQVMTGCDVTLADIPEIAPEGAPVVVTAALDDFVGDSTSQLSWRGVRLEWEYLPDAFLAQEAMVINVPDPYVPWTRTIETKWAVSALHDRRGTVVMHEFPGADVKHYPVADVGGKNAAHQHEFEQRLAHNSRNRFHLAGRLATYRYINMDQAVRQGLDVARRIAGAEG